MIRLQKTLTSLFIGVVLLMVSGCAGLGINVDISDEALYSMERIAARTLAYKIAEKNPELVDEMSNFCGDFIKTLDAQENVYTMILNAKQYLGTQITDDPLMQANFSDLLSLLNVSVVPAPDTNVNVLPPDIALKLRVAAVGFLEGLILQSTGTFVRVE